MSDASIVRRWARVAGLVGLGVAAAYAAPRVLSALTRKRGATSLLDEAASSLDQRVGWTRLPLPIALFTLSGLRQVLRAENLFDTSPPAGSLPPVAPPANERYRTERTIDGTYNDLDDPRMGSTGTRFGRNAPIADTYPSSELVPNPRTVSRELLTRDTFVPAPTLNVLAAAWLQFMIRDWFSHGRSETENPWVIPVEPDDWPHGDPMKILRTQRDQVYPGEEGLPPTYRNTETHWWDASHIYGTDPDFQKQIRTEEGGKLKLGPDQMVHLDDEQLVHQPSLAGWWAGQSVLFSLFVQEHNAICEHLRREYPRLSDESLFQTARLVNAALIAKIHTAEWTTAILGHPALQIGMRANWWGLAGERIYRLFGRLSDSELISGIPGSKKDHFGVPYSLTEEFVAVYRMHPLIPDDYELRSAETGVLRETRTFRKIAGLHARETCKTFGMRDLLYSFGIANPGAVTLHNYPRFLQEFERPEGIVIDLAAHDILRTRELGVPRYCRFREMLRLRAPRTFEELTDNPEWQQQLGRVYDRVEDVDLMVGLFAERPPAGFGFSDTAFRIFILMASRRLNSDRFFTTDFTPEVYTPAGMRWLDETTMGTILLRHYPQLGPALRGVRNAFAPWTRLTG